MTSGLNATPLTLATPQYVLMDVNRRIGPAMKPSGETLPNLSIYGFANKSLYDAFRLNTSQPLIPYPLVKRYLTKMIDDAGDALSLIVLDANHPAEPTLQAATVQAVLEAQNKGEKQIAASHQLDFDAATKSYLVTPIA
jgi:hypothetical protein